MQQLIKSAGHTPACPWRGADKASQPEPRALQLQGLARRAAAPAQLHQHRSVQSAEMKLARVAPDTRPPSRLLVKDLSGKKGTGPKAFLCSFQCKGMVSEPYCCSAPTEKTWRGVMLYQIKLHTPHAVRAWQAATCARSERRHWLCIYFDILTCRANTSFLNWMRLLSSLLNAFFPILSQLKNSSWSVPSAEVEMPARTEGSTKFPSSASVLGW